MYKEVYRILDKYPKNKKRSAINPLLDLAQRQSGGYIPISAMKKIADICSVPEIEVYESATFYIMHNK